MTAQAPRKIALIWIGRLGDMLVATGFMRSLREKYPQAQITLVARDYVSGLAEMMPYIDKTVIMPSWANPASVFDFFFSYALRKFDICIDLNPSYSRTSGFITLLSKAPERISWDKYRANWFYTKTAHKPSEKEHMISRYRQLASVMNIEFHQQMLIHVPQRAKERAKAMLDSLNIRPGAFKIAVHPGNFKKFDHRWPEDKFIELSKRILTIGNTELIYIMGPGEERPVGEILRQLPGDVKKIPPQSIADTAALLELMDLLIVNPTGTMHLAAALGTPMVCFQSDYTYNCWRPLQGVNTAIASHEWNSCRNIHVDTAWHAVSEMFKTLTKSH